MNQYLFNMHALPFAISAIALLCFHNVASATILTVHNDPLYNAQYSSIGPAITAANDFDTILVHGSANTYGTFTLTKPLTVIGPGHDPANGDRAQFASISLNAGSDGSVLEGITVSTVTISTTNIRVERSRLTTYMLIHSSGNNALIRGNHFYTSYIDVSASAENVEVVNNFFTSTSTGTQFRDGSATTLVHWNVFVRSSTSTSSSNVVFSNSSSFAVFADNVFITATVAAFNPGSCPNYSFQSNLSYSDAGTLVSMGPNNLDNTAPTWDLGGDFPEFSYEHDYTMLSGAPATGASDGGQVGVMGGNFPLVNSGLPSLIPRVTATQLETPYVPVGGSIDVNFQAVQGQP